MSRMIRLCLFLLLSLALAGAGLAAGAGHAGPMPGQTEMVICAGDSTETITLDAAGNRVDPADCTGHDCPDCLQPLAAILPPVLARPLPASARRETRLPQPEHPPARTVVTATARGPPTEV